MVGYSSLGDECYWHRARRWAGTGLGLISAHLVARAPSIPLRSRFDCVSALLGEVSESLIGRDAAGVECVLYATAPYRLS